MHRGLKLIAVSLGVATLIYPGGAQTPKPKAAAKPAATTAAPVVAPDIRAALDKMANAMKAMQSFDLQATTTSEEVLETGQKIQSSATLSISVRRPDRFYIDLNSERRNRKIFYDGKQVTIFSPPTGYFATVDAPATIRATLDAIADRYGVETPLADLFEWGASGVRTEQIKSALHAGPDRIGDAVCDHYAFRQTDVDWQLWIRREGEALPCRLVIVNTDDPSQPQTTMDFNWTSGAQLADDKFHFTPPKDAFRIQIGNTQTAALKKGG